MNELKERMLEDVKSAISATEEEIKKSDDELAVLNAKVRVEKKIMNKKEISAELKEDFKYSVIALESLIIMEEKKNLELKKELEMAKLRQAFL